MTFEAERCIAGRYRGTADVHHLHDYGGTLDRSDNAFDDVAVSEVLTRQGDLHSAGTG